MDGKTEGPLDTRLLSDAIIELNISRRNVNLYPRGHSLVNRSLDRAFKFLEKLFLLREEIVIAVAKDTLVVDSSSLDSKNPVYREFAVSLYGLNITCVRFRTGLAKEELYSFLRLLAKANREITTDNAAEVMEEYGLKHIIVVPVDYSAFVLEEGKTRTGGTGKALWAQYVKGLLDGTLRSGDVIDEIRRIPPETLTEILNGTDTPVQEETYDEVISTYLRKASERWFTGAQLRKLMEVVDGLNPRLKKEFLESSVRVLSRDTVKTEKAVREIPEEKVMGFLRSLDEQKVRMPKVFRNLVERFSELKPEGLKKLGFEDGLLADDFFLSRDMVDLLDERRYEEHIPLSYQQELRKIMDRDIDSGSGGVLAFEEEWSEERIARDYNQVILELLAAEVSPELAGGAEAGLGRVLKGQLEKFAARGEYGRIQETVDFVTGGIDRGGSAAAVTEVSRWCDSPELVALLAGSFRSVGRHHREEAALLCRRYGEKIVPLLLDALGEESSQAVRKFLIGLLTGLRGVVVPEARKRLTDERWYVKRNIILVLDECGGVESLDDVRPYCRHDDLRVRTEAVRCLLRHGDDAGLETLHRWLRSGSREESDLAASLAGSFKVTELIPELTAMLGQKARKKKDFEGKISIVRALGQIGDSRAMDSLRDVLASSSIFFRADLERLRKETRRALEKFLVEDNRRGKT